MSTITYYSDISILLDRLQPDVDKALDHERHGETNAARHLGITVLTRIERITKDIEDLHQLGANVTALDARRGDMETRILVNVFGIDEVKPTPDRSVRTFSYTVTVAAETREQADQVMAERINHAEDYGFPYKINIKGA